MYTMEGVDIRQAVVTDKAAVLAIQENVYEGLDYLEALYEEFINCPQSTPYVLVYNNEIVSFATAVVVDEGATVISRGGRTKDECAGKGFYKMLSQHCLETSGANVLAFTANNLNTATTSTSFRTENKHILSKPLLRFDVDAKSLPAKPSDSRSNVAELTKPQLEHYMTSEPHKQYLFPDDRLIINWVPFRLLPSNVPLLWAEDETSLRLSDVRQENDGIGGLLSFSTDYYGTGGMFVVNVDIYGTDVSSLKGHLEAHMEFAHQRGNGTTVLLVYCNPSMTSSAVKIFADNGIEETIWELNVQNLFEKQL